MRQIKERCSVRISCSIDLKFVVISFTVNKMAPKKNRYFKQSAVTSSQHHLTIGEDFTMSGYRLNTHTVAPTHPLGVKPSGNALLEGNKAKDEVQRRKLLGKFDYLNEEALIFIISLLKTPRDLLNFGHASRILYAYTYSEDLWRKLYVDEYILLEENLKEPNAEVYPFGCRSWRGTWRKTVLGLDSEALIHAHDLVFSDYLYRPYQCSQIDFEHLFRKVINNEQALRDQNKPQSYGLGVERIDEEHFTLSAFEKHYVDKPFILQSKSASNRWPSWTMENLLSQFASTHFRQEAVKWPLSVYADYFKRNCDESPLYLFDCSSEAIRQLQKEYEVPKVFQNDLFKVFQNGDIRCRPDHRWLIAGPQGSGSTFHKDPNYTSAWNAALSGKKLWVMLPPNVSPPGVSTDEEEEEVTSPVGVAEWVLSGFYNDAVKLAEDGKCFITVTFPGDCIYVPSGWWHTVINLTDSVALTENFVPSPVLPKALHFFSSKRSQISGFHHKDTLCAIVNFLRSHEAGEDEESARNFQKLQKFKAACADLELDNSDCGLSDGNAEIPVYEFFVELLRASKFGDSLPSALEESNELRLQAAKEKQKDAAQALKTSEIWTNLASESGTAFSFGFTTE
ncbi:LAFA_0G14664g1_1 [Lachancea sp. 'fantastica']|nr:LAFA_0G14664g1_1 [Lachancea sp. 'fantastica']